MDLGDPTVLISGLFLGLVGMGLLMYGKKVGKVRCIAAGLALCIYPYFVSSLLLMWGLAALCVGGLYASTRLES